MRRPRRLAAGGRVASCVLAWRARRLAIRRAAGVLGLLVACLLFAGPAAEGAPRPRTELAELVRPLRVQQHCLRAARLDQAKRFAAHRRARVSFAFADECGRLLGAHRYRLHPSASVVKVMLLAAYLRRDDARARALSLGERHTLGAMIKRSDNKAASEVFAVVGEGGLDELAGAAAMRRFHSSSSWGGSGITAADQASFIDRLEHYVPSRHEDYALGLLARVIPEQRWGTPEVAPPGWKVHFKSGWYPAAGEGWRVNQVATLRRKGRSVSLAVLSDANNSFRYGRETIRRLAKILLADYRR